MPQIQCELCRSEGPMQPWYADRGIVRCPGCELIFFPAHSVDTHQLYTEKYFRGGEYLDYVEDKQVIQENFQKRIDELKRLKPAGRLLEIGCAYGFFLDLARKHWDVKGVDISPEGIRHARETLGLDVEQSDFLAMPDQPESYDIICMWDTIEHLPQPVRLIEKASRWLKPGGLLVMTTGDIGSWVARFRKEKWRQIHPPTHLYYFSADTLTKAIEQASLRPRSVSYVGYTRRFKAMAYGIFCLGMRVPFLYRLLTLGGRLDFPIYLNLRDIMMLVAEKPSQKLT